MVYIEDLESFMGASQQLFVNSPGKTRYVIKYRHTSSKLVVKVTDDSVCLKYKTDKAQDAKKLGKLNAYFLQLSAAPKVDEESSKSVLQNIEQQESQTATAQQSQSAPQGSGKKGKKKGANQ
mmetsp:Transcript_1452/g.2406  ORF Transcript_1452/g.2406 Transcript_1452/m.2406 type:complete len:122 (+) Transcript_1452:101-466(+)